MEVKFKNLNRGKEPSGTGNRARVNRLHTLYIFFSIEDPDINLLNKIPTLLHRGCFNY